MDVPGQQSVPLHSAGEASAVIVEVAHHHRHGEARREDTVVIETESCCDDVEYHRDQLRSLLQALTDPLLIDISQGAEQSAPRDDSGDVAEEPLEAEPVAGCRPALPVTVHLVPRFGPRRADLGERQVALRELRAPRVDPIEDVDDNINGLVLARDLLDVHLALLHLVQPVEAAEVEPLRLLVIACKLFDGVEKRERITVHEVSHVHPRRVVRHLARRIELKALVLHIEVQSNERLCLALEELRHASANDAVQARCSLLTIEQELYRPFALDLATTRVRGRYAGVPRHKTAERVPAVQRREETPHLLPVPDIPALELRKCNLLTIDLIEDSLKLHRIYHLMLKWPRARWRPNPPNRLVGS